MDPISAAVVSWGIDALGKSIFGGKDKPDWAVAADQIAVPMFWQLTGQQAEYPYTIVNPGQPVLWGAASKHDKFWTLCQAIFHDYGVNEEAINITVQALAGFFPLPDHYYAILGNVHGAYGREIIDQQTMVLKDVSARKDAIFGDPYWTYPAGGFLSKFQAIDYLKNIGSELGYDPAAFAQAAYTILFCSKNCEFEPGLRSRPKVMSKAGTKTIDDSQVFSINPTRLGLPVYPYLYLSESRNYDQAVALAQKNFGILYDHFLSPGNKKSNFPIFLGLTAGLGLYMIFNKK